MHEIIKLLADYWANRNSAGEAQETLSSGTDDGVDDSHKKLFELAEQFDQERYQLSPEEEAAMLDEEYLEWLENN